MYERKFGDRDPVASPGTALGSPGHFYTVLAQVPDVLAHHARGFVVFQAGRDLPPLVAELAKARCGWARSSQLVYSGHCKGARRAGASEEQIAALPHWQVADCFAPVERAALAYADALVLGAGRVPDGLFAALRAELSEPEIVELTYAVTTYDAHARTARALRLEFDDRPDPLAEPPPVR